MKKWTITVSLLLVTLTSLAQEISARDKALSSARRKRVAGIIFVSSGAAVAAGGFALYITADANEYNSFDNGDIQRGFGALFMGVGTGLMVASVPFFIGAQNARNRAEAAISLKAERFEQIRGIRVSTGYYPSLSVQIALGGR